MRGQVSVAAGRVVVKIVSRVYPAAQRVVVVHGGAGLVPATAHPAHVGGCRAAAARGYAALVAGASAVDAACEAVHALEDDPSFNAGHGACLDETGRLALDAALMCGHTLAAGAVACLPAFSNPIRIARAILDEGGPVLLAGDGAADFALRRGFSRADEDAMITALARERLALAKATGEAAGFAGGTVGAVVRDARGHVAAATSTGGKTNKARGRIGDSPLVGAGTYASDEEGAASGTGDGEAFVRLQLARHATLGLRAGRAEAARDAIELLGARLDARGGIVLVAPDGRASFARNTPTMGFAVVGDGLDDAGI